MKEKIQEIADKEKELQELKRNAKSTKMQEMESELKMYTQECSRLRQQLEQLQLAE